MFSAAACSAPRTAHASQRSAADSSDEGSTRHSNASTATWVDWWWPTGASGGVDGETRRDGAEAIALGADARGEGCGEPIVRRCAGWVAARAASRASRRASDAPRRDADASRRRGDPRASPRRDGRTWRRRSRRAAQPRRGRRAPASRARRSRRETSRPAREGPAARRVADSLVG